MADFSKPKSMVDQIYLSISKAITTGILEPGCRLVEQDLQKDFGVSRAPIREAIRLLEADGLVVVDAYTKKYVRNLTREDLTDNIPVLACLESLAAKLAAEKITPEQIEELEAINREIQHEFTAGNFAQCAALNFAFHRTFLKVADNKALRRAIRSIVKSTMWLWLTTQYYKNNTIIPSSIAEHGLILDAFKRKDTHLVENQVKEHIENVLDRFLKQSKFDTEGRYQFKMPPGHSVNAAPDI
ncbi:MAG: GntR family transcriptional regulator [Proteobacteria bacterium]|nr:GntR family transcriptional regulator [Pseudomonadota bacterium]MBU1452724.1 GntR family transcriptional regulator [Pseudomonadota bacterium]MBU2467864.1 GntR family transcriptional regulator [Pseudomonadota bacterium]MBU2519401.1 GntR family transcriptional regulator [Pseudomonadota bacterium]